MTNSTTITHPTAGNNDDAILDAVDGHGILGTFRQCQHGQVGLGIIPQFDRYLLQILRVQQVHIFCIQTGYFDTHGAIQKDALLGDFTLLV